VKKVKGRIPTKNKWGKQEEKCKITETIFECGNKYFVLLKTGYSIR